MLSSIELCAGGGGQALGLEQAGFNHQALIEIDKHCCATLRSNRPFWNIFEQDLHDFNGSSFKGIDLIAAGLPCPPFSKAGKQLGELDERNLFPRAVDLIDQIRPRAIIIENVRGIFDSIFENYRNYIVGLVGKLGYKTDWRLLNASDFGVSQLRPRAIFIGIRKNIAENFEWPSPNKINPPTVGELLYKEMSAKNWRGVKLWKERANQIAPTIVGGSKKHGGPDLGPTRARLAWANLGVDGTLIATDPPERDFIGMPRLTNKMIAKLQGFPDDWEFSGKKTPAFRQIGNAFPPPVAFAVGSSLYACLSARRIFQVPHYKKAK